MKHPTAPSRISVPKHAHPLSRLLFSEMARQRVTYWDLHLDSGVLVSTVKAWRLDNVPGLSTIEAALGALGWSVLPVPSAKALPADLRADLQAVADKHQRQFPALEFVAIIAERAAEARLAGTPPVTRNTKRIQIQQERLAA